MHSDFNQSRSRALGYKISIHYIIFATNQFSFNAIGKSHIVNRQAQALLSERNSLFSSNLGGWVTINKL